MISSSKPLRVFAVCLAGLFLLYGFTRLLNLTLLPIFTDEAIYIRWSQIGANDANWRFISLTDGKQPMFTWIMMVLLKLIDDPLLAGRLVSVIAGIGSMVGLFLLSGELFSNRRIALISLLLYVLSPFALMYDRLALYDSLVATFFIWNLYLSVLLAKRVRLDTALLLGMMLGAGMLNKTSGFLSFYLLPSTFLMFNWTSNNRLRRLLRWIFFVFVAFGQSQVMYGVLRLSPFFHMIAQKDTIFIYPISDWLTHPFKFLQGNLNGLFDWLRHYMTLPVFVLSFLPALYFWNRGREKLLLYIWWGAPFFMLALFGKVLYPRFILFMMMPLLILGAVSLEALYRRFHFTVLGLFLYSVALFPSIYAGYFIITNPLYAPIPFSDRGQLIDDWPSGWGVREVNAFLAEEAKKGKIAVFTEGTFGLMPYAIEIYHVYNKNITISSLWPLPKDMPAEIAESARNQPTYMVLNESQEPPAGWPLEQIGVWQKGLRKDRALRLYKVVSPIASSL